MYNVSNREIIAFYLDLNQTFLSISQIYLKNTNLPNNATLATSNMMPDCYVTLYFIHLYCLHDTLVLSVNGHPVC